MVPKHEQLRTRLERLCLEELSPGDALPSERQLCVDHGVSRITVRNAIGQLVDAGLLVRIRGKGTFVAERHVRSQLHLASFHEDMKRLGLTPTTVVLFVRKESPPPKTAVALGLRASDRAFHVRRLRLADGVPIAVDDAWYNASALPGLDRLDLSGSIYTALSEHYRMPIDHAEQTVGAAEASDTVATLLGIQQGASVLVFDRVSYSSEVPLEHAKSWYRADRYELQMTLTG
ncbi:MAG: GntR family transcriptional regulator [Gordonia sp. (in: high G+C Gram-positive bacteria)]